MSASKITICPRCLKNKESIPVVVYGECTEEEYKECLKQKDEVLEETLLQYYEVDITEGKVMIDYFCKCETCDFEFSFNDQKVIDVL
jgi:hypothetical protein